MFEKREKLRYMGEINLFTWLNPTALTHQLPQVKHAKFPE